MKFLYGDSWEKYPIKHGETWRDSHTGSSVAVADLRNALPNFMAFAQMLYCDPPWNLGNANAFITKAGCSNYLNAFDSFLDVFFMHIQEISPAVCYLEMGKQSLEITMKLLSIQFPCVQQWEIRYYRKHPCYLLRGGQNVIDTDFTGLDDSETPATAIEVEHPLSVGDLCTGRGLTAVAAFKAGIPFYGTELNPRRLAVTIDRVNQLGGCYACTIS